MITLAAVQTGNIRIGSVRRTASADRTTQRAVDGLAILRDGDWAASLAIYTYLISHPEWLSSPRHDKSRCDRSSRRKETLSCPA
jgi:hypothetical protein